MDAGAPTAAKTLGSLFVARIDSLSERAERGHPVEGGRREINIKHGRSRYIVTYRVLDHEVIVTAVEHHLTRRAPPTAPNRRRGPAEEL